MSLCSPLIRADQGPLCGSSGLENKGKQGQCTEVRFLGGSRREGEGFTRITESNRRRPARQSDLTRAVRRVMRRWSCCCQLPSLGDADATALCSALLDSTFMSTSCSLAAHDRMQYACTWPHAPLTCVLDHVRRTAELHPAATRHEDSVQRDDAAHSSISHSVSVSRGAPREHRGSRDEIGSCAHLVVRTVCVHNHSGIFEQPQTVATTPMSSHELDTHSIDMRTVAGHRMGYHEYVHGAYYGLKYRTNIEHLKNVT